MSTMLLRPTAVVLAAGLAAGEAFAGGVQLECSEGFNKIWEGDGRIACRRAESAASLDLAEQISELWRATQGCNGRMADRQTGISEQESGSYVVTMRFFCLDGF